MNYCYTLKDAERWAEFSGDRNPVHFDLAHARQMGGENLMVHGMRAMLDMKRELSLRLLEGGISSPWMKFTARLRRPILCQQQYHLNVTRAGERFNARLSSADEKNEHYVARLAPASPQSGTFPPPGELRTVAITPALKACFSGQADDAAQRWVFLDAMLFKTLLSSPELLSALSEFAPVCQGTTTTLHDLFASTPVVQTHHEVYFSAELLASALEATLLVDIAAPQMVGNRESGYVMRMDIRGWSGDRPQLLTSITFRISPRSWN